MPLSRRSALYRRLLVTLVLVLVALGGAGLAAGADRPQTGTVRPELTARADLLFESWSSRMAAELDRSSEHLVALSTAGREALGRLHAQDLASLEQALADGEVAMAEVEAARRVLAGLRGRQAVELADSRLGADNRTLLQRIDAAAEALAGLPNAWTGLSASAGTVAGLVRAIQSHDDLVFEATAAGRDSRWGRALNRLGDATAALDEARAVRDLLARASDVTTLDELLSRYATYDAALTRLYRALDRGLAPGSGTVRSIRRAVAEAQATLPLDNSALTVIVADAAGSSVAQALVTIERARGMVTQALAEIPGFAPAEEP